MENLIDRSLVFFTRVTRYLVMFATVCLFVLMMINTVDIVGAKWFHFSVPGAIDLSEEIMVVLALLPISYIALERGNISVTLFKDRLPEKAQRFLMVFQYLIGTLVSGFFSWRVFVWFLEVFHTGQEKLGIEFPIWPANLAVLIGYVFLTLVMILLLIKNLCENSKLRS